MVRSQQTRPANLVEDHDLSRDMGKQPEIDCHWNRRRLLDTNKYFH